MFVLMIEVVVWGDFWVVLVVGDWLDIDIEGVNVVGLFSLMVFIGVNSVWDVVYVEFVCWFIYIGYDLCLLY